MSAALWAFSDLPILSNAMVAGTAQATGGVGLLTALFYALRERYHPWVNEIFQILLLLCWLPLVITVSHYLVLTFPRPLADELLAAPERWIGLPHPVVYDALAASGTVPFLDEVYYLINPQLAVVTLYQLFVHRDAGKLWQYAATLALAALPSIPVLWLLPTLGPTELYAGQYRFDPVPPPSVEVLEGLRQGLMVDTQTVTGMLACPSFHTVFALLLMRAVSNTHATFRWPVYVLNVLIIVSTITTGGHYLIDILGGIAWTAGAALLADRIGDRLIGSPWLTWAGADVGADRAQPEV